MYTTAFLQRGKTITRVINSDEIMRFSLLSWDTPSKYTRQLGRALK